MKKNKFLALVLSAGVVFSLAACGGEQNEEPPATETWTDKQIVDAVMNSSALITSNTGTPMNPVEDYGDTYLNDIHSDNGGYVIASKSYNVISDVGNSYTVPVAWEITSSEKENFLTVKEDGGKNLYTPNWDLTETNDQVKVVLKGTATYNNTTATKNYNLTFIDDQVVIAIEDMKDATDVTVQGYITAFIEGGLYNDKEEWYQVLVQSGDYAFAVAMPYKDKFEDYKVGDAVQVIGTTKFYNGQRQVKNSATVEKLSGAEANAIVKPNTLKVDTVDDFDTTKLLSLASIEGAKVVKVEKIPYKDDEYGQVQAELLLKGKTFYVYADHYNKDYDDKKAFYDKLVEIRDSNGAKTLDMSGVLNNYRRAWVGSGNLGEDEVMAGTPALYLTSSETVTVSDKAYQEVDGINVSYNNEDLFVGETVQLGVTLAGSLVEGGATWTSSDEKIATVDENGLVTGVSAGKVTITATSKTNAEFSASVELECKVRAGQPEFAKTSVAEVLEVENEAKTAYLVTGKVTKLGNGDNVGTDGVLGDYGDYGNLTLTDGEDESNQQHNREYHRRNHEPDGIIDVILSFGKMNLHYAHSCRRIVEKQRLGIGMFASYICIVSATIYLAAFSVYHFEMIEQVNTVINQSRLDEFIQLLEVHAFLQRLVAGLINHLQNHFVHQGPLIQEPFLVHIGYGTRSFRNGLHPMLSRNHRTRQP